MCVCNSDPSCGNGKLCVYVCMYYDVYVLEYRLLACVSKGRKPRVDVIIKLFPRRMRTRLSFVPKNPRRRREEWGAARHTHTYTRTHGRTPFLIFRSLTWTYTTSTIGRGAAKCEDAFGRGGDGVPGWAYGEIRYESWVYVRVWMDRRVCVCVYIFRGSFGGKLGLISAASCAWTCLWDARAWFECITFRLSAWKGWNEALLFGAWGTLDQSGVG